MTGAGLELPVVAKPDIGQRGDGVRPIRSLDSLVEYLSVFPPDQRIMLQALVETVPPAAPVTGRGGSLEDAREAGILYWRLPGSRRGQIFSITAKLFPEVVGDGRSTLDELIGADPRARHLAHVYLRHRRGEASTVLAEGQRMPLVFAGNHCQGAIFRDATHLATEELRAAIESVADSMPGFDFGRFDLKYSQLDELLEGTGFAIVEINGASGEATHIWDPSMTLGAAYRTLFRQFRILFQIGAANRARGHGPMGPLRFVREVVAYRRISRGYPSTR
jgi:hypothetical protein